MEITDKNLIINYLSFCSVSPSLFLIAEYSSSRGKEIEHKVPVRSPPPPKKKGMVLNKQRLFGNDFLGSPVDTDSQYTSVLRTWVFVLYLKVPEL